jgi:DNA-binding GntR family transcriptional regulator
VEIIPRRGMRVLPLNAADIADIFQVLSSLELLAVRLLAEREDNKESVERLQVEVTSMKRALAADDLDGWASADERFHRALVDESRNPRLAAAARTLLDQSQRFRIFTLRMRDRPTKSTRSHEALVAAIRRRDVEKALDEHSHHKVNWHVQMADILDKFGIRHI